MVVTSLSPIPFPLKRICGEIFVGLLTAFAGSTLAGSPLVSATDVGEGSSGLGFADTTPAQAPFL